MRKTLLLGRGDDNLLSYLLAAPIGALALEAFSGVGVEADASSFVDVGVFDVPDFGTEEGK